MDAGGSSKARERDKNQQIAGRLRHLREDRFETHGFRSNERTPSLREAHAMAGANARLYGAQRPQPRVTA